MPKAKKKDLDKMARIAAKGTIKDALLSAGYSPLMAAKGIAALPAGERAKFKQARQEYALKRLDKFADIGKKVTAEQQENVVRGALLANVAQGKDKATASLKMLGSDKRVAMFEPDSATGVIVINAAPIPPLMLDLIEERRLKCGCLDRCSCSREKKPQCDHYVWQICYCAEEKELAKRRALGVPTQQTSAACSAAATIEAPAQLRGDCGWDSNYKAPEAPELPKDTN